MYKVLFSALFLLSLGAQAESGFERYRADSGYDFYMGATVWHTNAEGGIQVPDYSNYTIDLAQSDINKRFNAAYFTEFKHPVRWLPNIRIAQNNIRHDGQGELTIASSNIPLGGALNLNHSDITLYYNVHRGIGFLDLGLTARYLNGELTMKIPTSSTTSGLNTKLGLLYMKTGVYLPVPGLSLETSINAGDSGKERSADASLYMQYETPFGLGVNGGYRYFNTDIESKGSINGLAFDLFAEFDVYGAFISMYYHL